jgi:hypothetical protein
MEGGVPATSSTSAHETHEITRKKSNYKGEIPAIALDV